MSLEDDYRQLAAEDTMPLRSLFRTTDVAQVLDRAQAVRALHRPADVCANPTHTESQYPCPECAVICETCGTNYPCPTMQALNGEQPSRLFHLWPQVLDAHSTSCHKGDDQ